MMMIRNQFVVAFPFTFYEFLDHVESILVTVSDSAIYFSEGLLSLFGWLVADGWCWFVLREKYRWLVAGGWFVVREKYCWLVADKPSEQADYHEHLFPQLLQYSEQA
jgi:hypothetical protein